MDGQEGDREPLLPEKLSVWQRMALRRIRKRAGKEGAEPLSSEDWPVIWGLEHSFGGRLIHRLWHVLPGSPRCGMCGAPFSGPGRLVTRPLGYRPSRKNPYLCATCVELSPPGGVTMKTGILFADVRGFTRTSEGVAPEEVSHRLRRFYGCAEEALFPIAVIDKLIGDEVMALYLAEASPRLDHAGVCEAMVEGAVRLLELVGYPDGAPFVEVGIGIDFGDAFVGNIGERAIFDFTAVGDTVNTAARLQGEAAGGEIVLSERVAERLDDAPGRPGEISLKGKERPVAVRRHTPFAAAAEPSPAA